MKDRLITAAGAILAALMLYALFFQSPGGPDITRPQSTEPGRDGYLALRRWLAESGVPVTSWRKRFDRLGDGDNGLKAAGNILFTTMPHAYPLQAGERQQLERWIRQGNTLLIAAALDDSPEWLDVTADGRWLQELAELARLSFRPREQTADRAVTPQANLAVPARGRLILEPFPHPLMDGVATLEAVSDGPSSIWIPVPLPAAGDDSSLLIRLARTAAFGTDAVWQRPLGDGQILLVSSASLFANHQIGAAQNARFIANIVGRHLGTAGSFVFDDMHQGLSALYDPAAFYADSRLHATIAFLVAAWLIYLLGSSNRLAPVRRARAEPRQADWLAAVGGFMARRLDRRETGLLLFEEWFAEIRRRRGLARGDEPPWEALQATPTLSRARLHRLRALHERLAAGASVDLVQLNNLLRQAREAIG